MSNQNHLKQAAADMPDTAPDADERATDTGRATRIGLLTLLLGFGGFLLWAAYAPLDEGVPTSGMVSIDTKRKAVQHLTGGIVRDVLVREGDTVKQGQVLMRLDSATARANYEAVRQRYLGYRAVQGRLLAEQAGAETITFHPDLLEAKSDPLIAQQILTQQQLFRSRKAALAADLKGIEESIQGQQALLKAYQSMLESRRRQLALLTEELENTRSLVKDG
jgi:protease secretion system membrane fusion protein